jgi:hypothetical protein
LFNLRVFNIFGRSYSRTEELDREVKKRFPSAAPTRLSYNGRMVHTLYNYREDVLNLFQGIFNNPDDWDEETYNSSRGFEVFLKDFDTNYLLGIFANYFSLTDALFEIRQTKTSDRK